MVAQKSMLLVISTMLALTCLIPQVSAFWRLPCHNPVSVQRADPVVDPGKVSGHLHTIMGGNGFGFTMDYNAARNSTCSSCIVTSDLSNYWIPSLFYQAKNGTFTPVKQNGGATIYYLQRRGSDDEKILAFPEGFRMLAGDTLLRSYTDVAEQKAISYACIDFNSSGGPETPGFPQKTCINGWRLQLFFPSCWDGKNLDSPDHKSHMAYPDGVTVGKCPSTHPIRFISIFYEVLYQVNDFADQWFSSQPPFVLSNGDPTGYGLHGDFVNGWDVQLLQMAINECNSSSGNIEDCPYFKTFSDNKVNDCFIAPRVNEVTEGWMEKLPGCNPVQAGPERAVVNTNCGATNIIGPPKKYYSDVSSKGWSYVDCAMDDLNSRTFPISMSNDTMTVEMCIDYCVSKSNSYAGMEYGYQCYCSNSPPAADLLGAKCIMPCAGDANQTCGDALRLSVYKKDGSPVVSASINSSTPLISPRAVPIYTRSATTTVPSTAIEATSTTATYTGTPISANVPSSTPTGWVAKGCWVDPINPRVLDKVGYWGQKITTSGCIKYCDMNDFKYAGTEYSGQCYCFNKLAGGKSALASECDMPCEGNSKEMCGGSTRLSLFEKTENRMRSFHALRHRHRNT